MWHTLAAHTPLYRATWSNDTWADVLQGYGAYFSSGGRYNTTHQPTIYASPDPLAALAEYGWHLVLNRCKDLGEGIALAYPFATVGKLWRFEFTTPVSLVDVADPTCAHQFGYPAHAAYNPHPERYRACRQVADQLRAFVNVPQPHTRPEGLLAPSLRTPGAGRYLPQQVILFVTPAPAVVPQTLQTRGSLLDAWDIEMEFLTVGRQPVTVLDPRVAWRLPRYRLSGSANPLPRFKSRPRSQTLPLNTWHSLDIQYSPF